MRTENKFAQSIREKRYLLINLLDKEPNRKKLVKTSVECVRSMSPLFRHTGDILINRDKKTFQRHLNIIDDWCNDKYDDHQLRELKYIKDCYAGRGSDMIWFHANCAMLELFVSIASVKIEDFLPSDVTEYEAPYLWTQGHFNDELNRKLSAPFWAIDHVIQAHTYHIIYSACWLERKFFWQHLENKATNTALDKIITLVHTVLDRN